MDLVKTCTKCGSSKPLEDFYIISQRGKPYRRARCKACEISKSARWTSCNRERANANRRAWAKSNPGVDSSYVKRWRKQNPDKFKPYHCSWVRHRQLAQVQATPRWSDEFLILEAYDLAQRRSKSFGFAWHVDHIVPIKSRLVCGLHVYHNLQVIPGSENRRKLNRHWPDMPC